VADILEGLRAVLASDVQKDFLATAVGNVLAACQTWGGYGGLLDYERER